MFYTRNKVGIFRKHSGQVAPFLILVVAVLFLAIIATMRIGEVALARTRMATVADSALISSATGLARTLNQIRTLSLGSGGMLVNYVALQVYLLARGIWPYKGAPIPTGFFINSMLNSRRLYKEAKRLAADANKELRISLWDRVMGGALIDEPKPYKDIPYGDITLEYDPNNPETWDEIRRDPEPDGEVVGINRVKWFARDGYFTQALRQYKKNNPTWYDANTYSYSWDKKERELLPGEPGYLQPGEPGYPAHHEFISGNLTAGEPQEDLGYATYLRVGLENTPTVSVSVKMMIMVYLYAIEKPPFVMIGIIPHPYAWIKSININYPDPAQGFGMYVSRPSYTFFKQEEQDEQDQPTQTAIVGHVNRAKIQGSIWRGFEPKLER